MKNRSNARSLLLTAVLLVVLTVLMVVKCLYPAVILPKLNIPNMVLLSLIALLAETLFFSGESLWLWDGLLAAVAFGLLPAAAGFVLWQECWKYALVGGVTFTLTALAMDGVRQRIASGVRGKAALGATALGIYLAAQCFTGILL